jgi:hypothetical protein
MGALRVRRVFRVSKVNRNFSRKIERTTRSAAAASADLTYGMHCASLTACSTERESMDTYTITRLDGWTDEQWDEIVEAVEDTVAAVGEDFERNT